MSLGLLPSFRPKELSEMEKIELELKNFVKAMVCGIVDQPEYVEVKPVQGEQTLVLEIMVPKSELGKVIGKKGRNAQSMRTLLAAAATRLQVRAVMEIVE